jgi:hypothetical protein
VHNPQLGKNEIIDIGNSQRLSAEGNNRISKLSAMRPGLGKSIGQVCISRKFESPEIDDQIAGNSCSIDYGNIGSSQYVPYLTKSDGTDHNTTKGRVKKIG